MEIPAILRQGNRPPPPDFFRTLPKGAEMGTSTNTTAGTRARAAAGSKAAAAAAPGSGRDHGSSPPHRRRPWPSANDRDNNDTVHNNRDREEYGGAKRRNFDGCVRTEEDFAAEVRSGRLDTLGWVSASWEPRCVVLRTDGSMSVGPLSMVDEGSEGWKHGSRSQQRHRRGGGDGGDDTDSATPLTAARAAKMQGGGVPNLTVPPSPPNWAAVLKSKAQVGVNGGNGKNGHAGVDGGGGGGGVTIGGMSASARTEGMTTWASNTSNASSNLRSTSSRLASGLLAVAAAAASGGGGSIGGGREQQVPGSPTSSATSVHGSGEKVRAVCIQMWSAESEVWGVVQAGKQNREP